jgi:molybdopterin converting factor small subunit
VKVTVKMGAPLSQVVGAKKVILEVREGMTLADVLDELRARYPDFEEGLKGKGLRKPFDRILYSLFVNARPVPFEEAAKTALTDGDRISLFLPVVGG